jgi:16S rRNA (guanine966-N2)-methyltransferase
MVNIDSVSMLNKDKISTIIAPKIITVSDMNHSKSQQGKKNTPGSIRLIAGKHRGRKLPVLMSEGLRPTTDRVKETVFNWLMPYIHDSICLDCFAGSGSLGFEAMSRGAEKVTLLELNKVAAKQLLQNKILLKSDNVQVEQVDSLQHLRQGQESKQVFDLVFLDPPFHKGLAEQAATLLNEGWLTPNALIYVEMESQGNSQKMPSSWRLLKEKVAGKVVYQLYQNTNY